MSTCEAEAVSAEMPQPPRFTSTLLEVRKIMQETGHSLGLRLYKVVGILQSLVDDPEFRDRNNAHDEWDLWPILSREVEPYCGLTYEQLADMRKLFPAKQRWADTPLHRLHREAIKARSGQSCPMPARPQRGSVAREKRAEHEARKARVMAQAAHEKAQEAQEALVEQQEKLAAVEKTAREARTQAAVVLSEVDQLKARVEELEAENAALKARIAELEGLLDATQPSTQRA
jgi:hypothetical protein